MQVMVLNDGETFTDLDGCAVVEVPDGAGTEEVEELLAAGHLLVAHRFGPRFSDGPALSRDEAVARLAGDLATKSRPVYEALGRPWTAEDDERAARQAAWFFDVVGTYGVLQFGTSLPDSGVSGSATGT